MLRSIAKQLLDCCVNSALGRGFMRLVLQAYQYRLLSDRAIGQIRLDLLRSHARSTTDKINPQPAHPRLHVGCGERRVPGWLNIDLTDAHASIDLACGKLPWESSCFEAIVSQQVIEHLELHHELKPLIAELFRVCAPEAEVWLSCPDLEKVCNAYVKDKAQELLDDKIERMSSNANIGMDGVPSQHFVNLLFDQSGEHKNLFDLELLTWLLETHGFSDVVRKTESDFLTRFPEFPPRRDDFHSLYVRAKKILK